MALATACGSSLPAADPVPAPLDRLKERSATERWSEARSRWLKSEMESDPSGPEAPGIHRIENPKAIFQLEDAEPQSPTLAKPVPDPYGSVSLPETQAVAADEFLAPPSPTFVPPPLVTAQLDPVPPTPSVLETDDPVFRPISRIQPFYDYSPTSTKPNEYLCPQPESIPEEERFRCPEVQPLPHSGSLERHFAEVHFHWLASNLYHKPLYFEDCTLERYGHTCGEIYQPFVSIGKFGVQLIGLPYQMALDPVWRDQYALGYYRPGDPAPYLLYSPPLNLTAAAAAGGVYTGLIFLFP